ncbi:MAG: lipocalin-like domain-containing protein [Acidobacteria bacterium]|nr:lipocalin-like domain-containing protein [Acidobacteriota bacterium]
MRKGICAVSAACVVALLITGAFAATNANVTQSSASPAAKQFVGMWRLVSIVTKHSDGSAPTGSATLGPNPRGYIIYDSSGRMCVEIMNPDRARLAGTPPTADERAAAYTGYVAYCGKFVVNDVEKYVIHDTELDLNPNLVDEKKKRLFVFLGERLMLTPPSTTVGNDTRTTTLTWERVR